MVVYLDIQVLSLLLHLMVFIILVNLLYFSILHWRLGEGIYKEYLLCCPMNPHSVLCLSLFVFLESDQGERRAFNAFPRLNLVIGVRIYTISYQRGQYHSWRVPGGFVCSRRKPVRDALWSPIDLPLSMKSSVVIKLVRHHPRGSIFWQIMKESFAH